MAKALSIGPGVGKMELPSADSLLQAAFTSMVARSRALRSQASENGIEFQDMMSFVAPDGVIKSYQAEYSAIVNGAMGEMAKYRQMAMDGEISPAEAANRSHAVYVDANANISALHSNVETTSHDYKTNASQYMSDDHNAPLTDIYGRKVDYLYKDDHGNVLTEYEMLQASDDKKVNIAKLNERAKESGWTVIENPLHNQYIADLVYRKPGDAYDKSRFAKVDLESFDTDIKNIIISAKDAAKVTGNYSYSLPVNNGAILGTNADGSHATSQYVRKNGNVYYVDNQQVKTVEQKDYSGARAKFVNMFMEKMIDPGFQRSFTYKEQQFLDNIKPRLIGEINNSIKSLNGKLKGASEEDEKVINAQIDGLKASLRKYEDYTYLDHVMDTHLQDEENITRVINDQLVEVQAEGYHYLVRAMHTPDMGEPVVSPGGVSEMMENKADYSKRVRGVFMDYSNLFVEALSDTYGGVVKAANQIAKEQGNNDVVFTTEEQARSYLEKKASNEVSKISSNKNSLYRQLYSLSDYTDDELNNEEGLYGMSADASKKLKDGMRNIFYKYFTKPETDGEWFFDDNLTRDNVIDKDFKRFFLSNEEIINVSESMGVKNEPKEVRVVSIPNEDRRHRFIWNELKTETIRIADQKIDMSSLYSSSSDPEKRPKAWLYELDAIVHGFGIDGFGDITSGKMQILLNEDAMGMITIDYNGEKKTLLELKDKLGIREVGTKELAMVRSEGGEYMEENKYSSTLPTHELQRLQSSGIIENTSEVYVVPAFIDEGLLQRIIASSVDNYEKQAQEINKYLEAKNSAIDIDVEDNELEIK